MWTEKRKSFRKEKRWEEELYIKLRYGKHDRAGQFKVNGGWGKG